MSMFFVFLDVSVYKYIAQVIFGYLNLSKNGIKNDVWIGFKLMHELIYIQIIPGKILLSVYRRLKLHQCPA